MKEFIIEIFCMHTQCVELYMIKQLQSALWEISAI